VWQDLTLGPVTNDTDPLNKVGMDISSIYIDSHDTTGNTVYVTVEGAASSTENARVAYRTTDGGAHWSDLTANLPETPVSSIVVDPRTPTRSISRRTRESISQPRWEAARLRRLTAGRFLELDCRKRPLLRSAPLL